jgi:hypothetical protein
MDEREVRIRVSVVSKMFSSPHHADRLWGPISLRCNEYGRVLSLGLKQPGLEADHSPTTSVEVEEM